MRCIRPSWIIIIVRLHGAAELRRIKRRLQTAQIAAFSPSVGKEIILNQYLESYLFCPVSKFTEPKKGDALRSLNLLKNILEKSVPLDAKLVRNFRFDQSPPNEYDIHSRAGISQHLATNSTNKGLPGIHNQPFSTTMSPP